MAEAATRTIQDPAGGVHQFPADMPAGQIHEEMQRRWTEAHPPASMPVNPTPQPGGSQPGRFQPQTTAPAPSMAPLDDEAEQAKAMLRLKTMRGDRAGVMGAQNLLHSNPTYVHQQEQAKKMGDLAAEQATRQGAGEAILPGVDALRHMINEAPPADWAGAAGAYNTTKQPARAEVPMSWGAWNAPEMTPTQARAAFGYYWDDPNYQRQFKLQNEMDHLIGALTDQYVSAAGKGIAGSDARMELFRDLMGAVKRAPTQKDAHRILDTAENSIRSMFRLPARIRSEDEYKALSKGQQYIHPTDGTIRTKQ